MKKQLAEDICTLTRPIREHIDAVSSDEAYLSKVVAEGREKARASASATLKAAKEAVGFRKF